MDIKSEKKEKSQVRLEISLSEEEFAKYIEQAILELGKNLELKGFRKGKAPRDILEKALGKERILMEAGDMAVKGSYKEAVEKENLEPIHVPEVKIIKIGMEGGMSYEAVFTVVPEISLGDYKRIVSSVKKEKAEVGEKEVEGAIKWAQRSRAKFSAKLGPAQMGDFVEIEYWSPDAHEIGPDHKKKDAFILGEGHFFDGFEGALLGMNPGEEKKEMELDIPQDHAFKKIAGKKIKFNIKLNSVQKVEYPPLDDSFAKNLGNFENMKALEKSVKEGMISEKEYQSSRKARQEAVEKVTDSAKIDIPAILVEKETQRMFEDFKNSVPERLNMAFEDYLKNVNKTEEELKKMIAPEAEKKVKSYLVLREIGKKENVEASEEEIKEELKAHAGHDHGIDLDDLKEYAKEVIKTEKVYKIIENLIQ